MKETMNEYKVILCPRGKGILKGNDLHIVLLVSGPSDKQKYMLEKMSFHPRTQGVPFLNGETVATTNRW